MKYYTVLPLLVAAVAAQTTHFVTVGGVTPQATGAPTPNLGFSPESIKANEGDIVEFHFFQKNHTATQSTFANPCDPMPGGEDSGFKPNPKGEAGVTWQMTVKGTEAIWMFCAQTGHCGKGMVFAINAADAGDKTFTAYKQGAIKQKGQNLQVAGIADPAAAVANQPSTVTINAAPGNGGLTPEATVVPGQGLTPDGQACSCSCLCGANSFPPNVGIGSFGGIVAMVGS